MKLVILILAFISSINLNSQSMVAGFEERVDTAFAPHEDNFTRHNLTHTSILISPATTPWVTLDKGNIKFLLPGTYNIYASAPAYCVNTHRLLLEDLAGNVVLSGTAEHAWNGSGETSTSEIRGTIKVSANSSYYLHHYTQTVGNTAGCTASLRVTVPEGTDTEVVCAQIWITSLK